MTAPLVEPAAALSPAELQHAARHLTLPGFGVEAQRRLKAARVLVLGAGGLGSPTLLYLAAAGVGTLGVVDDDVVEESNLQRQVIHGVDDLGRPKAESAAAAIARLNPLVEAVPLRVRLTADNAADLLRGWHLVLDGADNFATRYLVADACEALGLPCVWGSILRFEGRASVFWAGRGPTYRDLHPEPPPAGAVPSCAEGGVLGALPATIGAVMATEAIKLITGIGEPLIGRVLRHDALAMTWRELRLEPDPEAPARPAAEVACAAPAAPGRVPAVSAVELAALLAGDAPPLVVDVRDDWERAIVGVPGAVAVPLAEVLERGWAALPASPDARIVVLCKAGARSRRAVEALLTDAPAARLAELDGGVLAWIDAVAPDSPRY